VGKAELEMVINNKKRKISFQKYGIQEGLPSNECISWSQYSGIRRKNGSIWMAMLNGICTFDPNNIPINKVPPKVIIEKILVDKEPMPPKDLKKGIDSKSSIDIYFTAPTFISPQKVKFKYQLVGQDSQWIGIQPEGERKISYNNLSPGDYTLMIKACNSDGIWNPNFSQLQIKLKTPLIRSVFFILFIFILPVMIGFSLYLINRKSLLFFAKKRYKTSTLSSEKKEEYLEKIIHSLEEKKLYRQGNIKLQSFSEMVSIKPHCISQVVNEKLNKNFRELINSYRIREAKKSLMDPALKDSSILEIAFDVGFNSKSAFNRVFKKHTGLTPSQFRKQNKLKPN